MLLVELSAEDGNLHRMCVDGECVVLCFIPWRTRCASTLATSRPISAALKRDRAIENTTLRVCDLVCKRLADDEASAHGRLPQFENLLLVHTASLRLVERTLNKHMCVFNEAFDFSIQQVVVVTEHIQLERTATVSE